jgi:hypothetical protein
MRPDGHLDWAPPAGQWEVLRIGYSLTGAMNRPASPEGTGLEVDKLDAAAVKRYMQRYLSMYRDATGGLIGAYGLRAMMFDSWEAWAGVVAAAWGVVAGIAVKRGRMRRVAAMSLNNANPWWWRNMPFALLPFSASEFLCLVAVAASSVHTQTVVMSCAFAFLIVAFVFLARPPRFLKPDWLLEQEQHSAYDS